MKKIKILFIHLSMAQNYTDLFCFINFSEIIRKFIALIFVDVGAWLNG